MSRSLSLKHPSQLPELLVQTGTLTSSQIEQLLQEQQRWGGRITQILVEKGLLREEQLVQLFHHEMRLPVITLDRLRHIPTDVVQQVPINLCETYDVFPVAYDLSHRRLRVAMSDPSDKQALQALQSVNGMQIEPVVTGASTIRWAIRVYFYGESIEGSAGPPGTRPPSSYGGAPNTGVSGYGTSAGVPHIQSSNPGLSGNGTSAGVPHVQPGNPGLRSQGVMGTPHPTGTPPHVSYPLPGTGMHQTTGSHLHTGAVSPGNNYPRPGTGMRQTTGHHPHMQQVMGGARQQSHPINPDISSPQLHSLGRSIAVTGQNTQETRLVNALSELQQVRRNFEQYKTESKQQFAALEELVESRFHEHRMMMRGLFDLLVDRNYLTKEELVHMISTISK